MLNMCHTYVTKSKGHIWRKRNNTSNLAELNAHLKYFSLEIKDLIMVSIDATITDMFLNVQVKLIMRFK